jgi:(2Fe-2S) ferredoxin
VYVRESVYSGYCMSICDVGCMLVVYDMAVFVGTRKLEVGD